MLLISVLLSLQHMPCHNKSANDFVFIGSSSFLATAGHSSSGNNVIMWDTLLPPRCALIQCKSTQTLIHHDSVEALYVLKVKSIIAILPPRFSQLNVIIVCSIIQYFIIDSLHSFPLSGVRCDISALRPTAPAPGGRWEERRRMYIWCTTEKTATYFPRTRIQCTLYGPRSMRRVLCNWISRRRYKSVGFIYASVDKDFPRRTLQNVNVQQSSHSWSPSTACHQRWYAIYYIIINNIVFYYFHKICSLLAHAT